MKYKLQMKKQFKDIRVTECGLLILENYPYIGAKIVSEYDQMDW